MPLGVDTTLVNSFDSIGLGFFLFIDLISAISITNIVLMHFIQTKTHAVCATGTTLVKALRLVYYAFISCFHCMHRTSFCIHCPIHPSNYHTNSRGVCVCVCAMCIDIYLFWVFHFVILCCLLWFGALVRFDFGMCVSWCLIPWCKLRSSTLFAYYTF